ISASADIICAGQTSTLTAVVDGGGAPYSYSWSPGGATTEEIEVSPTETTQYTVTVTDDCGSIQNAQITITVSPVPTASASSTAPPVCAGSTLQLTGTTDIGTSFLWTGPNG